MFGGRRKNILKAISKYGGRNLISFKPENIYYLTGFWGEGVLLVDQDLTRLYTPKLEYVRANLDSKDCEVVQSERGNDILFSVISDLKSSDSSITDCEEYNRVEYLRNHIGKKRIIVNDEPFFKCRMIKDKEEIRNIQNAAKIIDHLFEVCINEVKVGISERQLQATLVYEALKKKASLPSYRSTLNPFIIASGPNGALPHSNVSDRRFKTGDFIVVDITLRYKGYVGDATRTFALGGIKPEMKKIYEIVRESQDLGVKNACENTKAGEVDKICRDFISNRGYDEEFNHSTGHGIGLDVHEPPWISKNNKQMLINNMTITIEPGIYLKSKFGIRIEDSVIIDNKIKNGVKKMNKFRNNLVIL